MKPRPRVCLGLMRAVDAGGTREDRVAQALTGLTTALGKKAKKLDLSRDREGRIVVRCAAAAFRETEALLIQAGVKKSNTGIRDVYSFQQIDVVLSPYARAVLA